jgi:hypothetical protein
VTSLLLHATFLTVTALPSSLETFITSASYGP